MAGSHNYTMNINIKSEASGVSKTSSELTKLRQDVQSIDGKSINLKVSIGGAAGKEITGFLKNISSMEKSLNTLSTKGIQTLQQGFSSLTKSTTDAASGVGNVQKAVDSLNGKGPTDLASGMGDIAKTSTDAASGIGQVATAADSINTGNAEELASAYANVATEATSAASAMEKASGSSGGGVGGYPNWSNSYGGRYGGMRYTGQGKGLVDVISFIGNGKSTYELTIQNALDKTRNMAVAKSWKQEDGITGMDAYWALDTATNHSLMSLNTLAAGINATAATTGASAKDIEAHAQDFADFGTMVLGLGYDEAVAQTAVMKLGRGLHGTFAALDQYGITEESLKNTGLWNGDENDLDGYMAAVSEYSKGMSEQLMQTTTGQMATLSKSASLGGYALGAMEAEAMGGILSTYKKYDDDLRRETKNRGMGADVRDNKGQRVLERGSGRYMDTNRSGVKGDEVNGEKDDEIMETAYVDAEGNVVDEYDKVLYATDKQSTGEEKALQDNYIQKKTGIGLSTILIGAEQGIKAYKTLKDTVLGTAAEIKDLQRLRKYGFKGIFGNDDYEYMDGRIVKMRDSMKENAKGPCPGEDCPKNKSGNSPTSTKSKKKSRWQRFKDKFRRNNGPDVHEFPTSNLPSEPVILPDHSSSEKPKKRGYTQYGNAIGPEPKAGTQYNGAIGPNPAIDKSTKKASLSNREKLRRSGVMPTPKKVSSNVSKLTGKNLNAPTKKLIPNFSSYIDKKFYPDSMTTPEFSKTNLERSRINKNVDTRRQSLLDSYAKPTNVSSFNNKLKEEMKAGSGHEFMQNRRASPSHIPATPEPAVNIPAWQKKAANNRGIHEAKEKAWKDKLKKGQTSTPSHLAQDSSGKYRRKHDQAWLDKRREQRAERKARKAYTNKYGGFQKRTLGAIYDTKHLKRKAGKYIKTQRDKVGDAWGLTKRKSASKGNTYRGKARYGMTALRGGASRLGKRMLGSNAVASLQRQYGSLQSQGRFVKNSVTGSGAYKKLSNVAGAAKGQIVGNASAFGGMMGNTRVGKAAKNSRLGQAVSNAKAGSATKTAKSGIGRIAGGAKAVGGAAWGGASKAVGGIAGGIGKAAGAVGGLASGFMGLLGPIGAVIMGVTLITGLLDAMGVDWMGPLQTAFGGAFEAMQPLIQGFGQWMADTATAIGPYITSFAQAIAPILGAIGELISGNLSSLGEALLPIIEGIGQLFSGEGAGGFLSSLVDGLSGLLPFISPLTGLFSMLSGGGGGGLFEGLGGIASSLQPVLGNIIPTISSAITGVLDSIGSSLQGIIDSITSGIQSVIDSLAAGLQTISDTLTTIGSTVSDLVIKFGELGVAVTGFFLAVLNGKFDEIKTKIDAIKTSATELAQQFTTMSTSVTTMQSGWTSIQNSVMMISTGILQTITSLSQMGTILSSIAPVVAAAMAQSLVAIQQFGSSAIQIMASTAAGMSSAFASNFKIAAATNAEMAGAYAALCAWGDKIIAKAGQIGADASAKYQSNMGISSPGYIWRMTQAEFVGTLKALTRTGGHLVTAAGNVARGIVTSWTSEHDGVNYNPLQNIRENIPSTVTLPNTNVSFTNAALDTPLNSTVAISPVAPPPVDLPTLTEPKLVKDVRANAVNNNEPATVVFNHYGDTDNEERANKLMKYFSHKMSFENKRANRTV